MWPHPPLILGGETDHTLRRIVRVGDGWLPRAMNPQQVLDGMTRLKQFAEEAETLKRLDRYSAYV